MANGGGYAAYDNTNSDETGLANAFDKFHQDVTDAYVVCRDSGTVPTDAPTDDDIILTLSEMLGDAIHIYYLAASIDTDVTVPAQTVLGVVANPDSGPIDEQTGIGMGHLE